MGEEPVAVQAAWAIRNLGRANCFHTWLVVWMTSPSIRSMVSGFPLHPRANLLMHTGRNTGRISKPWVRGSTMRSGSENKNLPGYVLLHGGAVPPGRS